MIDTSTVLVADTRSPAYEAVLKLASLVERGVIRPFWFAQGRPPAAGPWTATYFDPWGETEVPLFSSLGEEETDRIRVVAIATVGDSAASSQIAEVAGTIADRLGALSPRDAAVCAARIWFPGWEDLSPPDPGFFTTHVDANLVAVPEDRRSDTFVASPVEVMGGGVFAGHVAAEVAVLTGLFAGMESTPLDDLVPGVIFGSDPKVRLVRSFVRIAQSPAIPLPAVVDGAGRLPVATGMAGAPAIDVAVADLAEKSAPLFERLVFEVRPPAPLERRQMGPGQTLVLILKEMGGFVVSLPGRALAGVLGDFSELAGRTMQDLVGSSSVVEVVWGGKMGPTGGREDIDAQIEALKHKAERNLDLHGGPSIDQTVWRDIRSLVLASVDGGSLPHGLEPVGVRGSRIVIDQASAISPRPDDTLAGTAAAIQEEAESEQPRSLLGRLGARIGEVAAANRTATARLLERLEADVSALASYRPPSLAVAHVLGALLLAATIVSILLFSGAVRALGVTEMSGIVKNLVFVVLTLACLLMLFLFRSYGLRANAELASKGAHSDKSLDEIGWSTTILGAVAGLLVGSLFVALGVADLGYPATEEAFYAALLAGFMTGAGLGQAFALGDRQLAPLARMSRLSILTVLGYVSVLLMGAVAQSDGWYDSATRSELNDVLWPVTTVLMSLLVTVLVYVSWRRVRERLTVVSYGSSIRQLSEQVNDALIGDRVADAAMEQFLGLSAVLSRIVWFPYGKSVSVLPETLKIESFGVNKAAYCEFGLSPRGWQVFEALTKSLAAERGWLGAQYERSVASYREAAALTRGLGGPGAVGRPDEDPATVAHLDVETRSDRCDRWRWALDLFTGKHDAVLMAALESFGEEEVFGPVLSESGNFEPVKTRGADRSLAAFIGEILPDGGAEVDARYFDPAHLAAGDFTRDWHSRVWWPKEPLFGGATASEVEPIEPLGSMAHGRVWLAIRADLTEDLQPAALYGEEMPGAPQSGPTGPEF